MGQLQIFRRRNYLRQVWKNGGGTTYQVAISPEGSVLTDFDWRISLAEITADCHFSDFNGYDRTLVLLEGGGLLLNEPEGPEIRLDPGQPMLSFRGETIFSCVLPEGPTLDFNVMTRRDSLSHRVEIFQLSHGQKNINIALEPAFIFCLGRSLEGESGGRHFSLERHDMLKIEGGQGGAVNFRGPEESRFLCISIFS